MKPLELNSIKTVEYNLPWLREVVLRHGMWVDESRRTADLVVCVQDQAINLLKRCETRREILTAWCEFKRRIYSEFGLCVQAVQSLANTRHVFRWKLAEWRRR